MPQPFIKFYFADWEGDAQLMACSLEAQGLWLRMMRVMHEATPYGFFVGRSGEPIDLIAFSRSVRLDPRSTRRVMAELERNLVFSCDSSGRIFSRKMVRDHARQEQLKANGLRGGNPVLVDLDNQPLNQNLDNQNLDNQDFYLVKSARVNPRNPRSLESTSSDSLRSSALAFGKWPTNGVGLRRLAMLFVAEFANCRDSAKAEKHVGHYAALLAQIRGRGLSISDAWGAAAEARDAFGGKPLFAAGIKMAMSFLPEKPLRRNGGANNTTAGIREFREDDRK